jgi:hypothetical protein
MGLLIPRSWRRQIFNESAKATPRSRFWYFVNRFVAGLGAFLVVYAISLTHPAMVNAIAGVRFGIIFLGVYLLTRFKPSWLQEDFRGWQLATKIFATCLVIAGLAIASIFGKNTGSGTSPAAMQIRPQNSAPLSRSVDSGCRQVACALSFPPTQ